MSKIFFKNKIPPSKRIENFSSSPNKNLNQSLSQKVPKSNEISPSNSDSNNQQKNPHKLQKSQQRDKTQPIQEQESQSSYHPQLSPEQQPQNYQQQQKLQRQHHFQQIIESNEIMEQIKSLLKLFSLNNQEPLIPTRSYTLQEDMRIMCEMRRIPGCIGYDIKGYGPKFWKEIKKQNISKRTVESLRDRHKRNLKVLQIDNMLNIINYIQKRQSMEGFLVFLKSQTGKAFSEISQLDPLSLKKEKFNPVIVQTADLYKQFDDFVSSDENQLENKQEEEENGESDNQVYKNSGDSEDMEEFELLKARNPQIQNDQNISYSNQYFQNHKNYHYGRNNIFNRKEDEEGESNDDQNYQEYEENPEIMETSKTQKNEINRNEKFQYEKNWPINQHQKSLKKSSQEIYDEEMDSLQIQQSPKYDNEHFMSLKQQIKRNQLYPEQNTELINNDLKKCGCNRIFSFETKQIKLKDALQQVYGVAENRFEYEKEQKLLLSFYKNRFTVQTQEKFNMGEIQKFVQELSEQFKIGKKDILEIMQSVSWDFDDFSIVMNTQENLLRWTEEDDAILRNAENADDKSFQMICRYKGILRVIKRIEYHQIQMKFIFP